MIALRALRPLVRVELRQLRRHPWRSLLVVLLIAVPVAAMVGGSALLHMTRQTVEEQRAQVLGRAQLRIDGHGPLGMEAVLARLPAHARSERMYSGHEHVWVPGRRRAARFFALEPGALGPAGLAQGLLRLNSGRQPNAAGEVALSRVLLAGLGVGAGDEVFLSSGPALITGEVSDPEDLDMPVVLRAIDPAQPHGAPVLLVDLPPSEAAVLADELEAAGARLDLRARTGAQDPFESLLVFLCGGFGFFEAALVVAAAFAVGLRRRQREIGLLAATGAPARGIRLALAVSAAVLACLGGLLGLLLGAGAARLLYPWLDGWTRRSTGAFELSTAHLVGALALGLITSLAASALPARSATRLLIRVALSGRRPVARSSGAWLVGGVGLLCLGPCLLLLAVWVGEDLAAACVLLGSILVVLGLGCTSPWLLERLATVAGPLPLAWRLAVRDAGRFRARNGPVVTAVLAGMSISVMLSALLASVGELRGVTVPELRDDTLLVEGSAAEELARRLAAEPSALAVAPLALVHARGQPVRARFPGASADGQPAPLETWIAACDADLLAVLGAEAGEPALAAGQLLAYFPGETGTVLQLVAGELEIGPTPACAQLVPEQRVRQPQALLAAERLDELGLQAGPPPGKALIPWLVRFEEPVTLEQVERARSIAAEFPGSFVDAEVLRFQPTDIFFNVVLLICIATGLVVVFVATTLSSVESQADARVLHTVGAAPSLLRGHLAARAGYLALLGCALSVPAGLMPVLGLQALANVPLEFVLPWSAIGITVLAMPAVAYGGTWIVAALRAASAPTLV